MLLVVMSETSFCKRPSKDIDVVVVGNGIELAERVCKIWGKKLDYIF